MLAILIICEVLLVIITSVLLILSILHKGKGGGISDMFGGGISTSMRSSGVAERIQQDHHRRCPRMGNRRGSHRTDY